MSELFRVEPQFHTLSGTTEIDFGRIPEYPVSERLRGIEGRNIVGQPWDVLAAQADRAKQAEERQRGLGAETGGMAGHIRLSVGSMQPLFFYSQDRFIRA